MDISVNQRKVYFLAVLVVIVCSAVLVVHWPALSSRAVLFDDNQYLTGNALVQNPSWTSIRRFLTEVLEPSTVRGYYQPLTMISLMADYALGGRTEDLQPFHRTSLILHVGNTALMIVLLYLLFGNLYAAAMAGLLFGLHPVTVEPIPWVAERKTLLAAFFALWCLILYVRYTQKKDRKLYIACLVMYVLALMSKPTITPLPVVMLLIDYWPLRRLKRRAFLEKLPLFVIGGISAIITYVSQSRTSLTILPGEYNPWHIPFVFCHNIIFYLYKIIWPANLSPYYGFPKILGFSNPMVLAGTVVTCIMIPLVVISLRWTRGILTGWLIFFLSLLPVIGIIEFTSVIAADRHAYFPSIGLLMVLTSFLGWFCDKDRIGIFTVRRLTVVTIVLILAGAEAVATRRYLTNWRHTMILYKHTLSVTPDAVPVLNNLAVALGSKGNLGEAIYHLRHALKVNPHVAETYNNLGMAYKRQGKLDEAIIHFERALALRPDSSWTHCNLGMVFAMKGLFDRAFEHFIKSARLQPYNMMPWKCIRQVLKTHPDQKVRDLKQAIDLVELALKQTEYRNNENLAELAAAYESARLNSALP